MLKVNVLGQDTLAAAVRKCCEPFFEVSDQFDGLDFLWVCYDTPILSNYQPDGNYLMERFVELIPKLGLSTTTILISSQVPPGFLKKLQLRWPSRRFAYSPENIRAAHAYEDFKRQPRIFVGTEKNANRELLYCLLKPFTENLFFVSIETSEMIKHALNGFLAVSVAYGNEISRLCSVTGADAHDVAEGLMSDPRIGNKAYLKPGGPYGPHLQREIYNLNALSDGKLPLLSAIHTSNEVHAGRARDTAV